MAILTHRQVQAINKAFNSVTTWRSVMDQELGPYEDVAIGGQLEEMQTRQAATEIEIIALQVSSPNTPKAAKQVFTVGSTSGLYTLITLPSGSGINLITAEVSEPFNSPATLTVGTLIEQDRFLALNEVDLETLGAYTTTPTEVLSASTIIVVNFNKSFSTLGSVEVQISYS